MREELSKSKMLCSHSSTVTTSSSGFMVRHGSLFSVFREPHYSDFPFRCWSPGSQWSPDVSAHGPSDRASLTGKGKSSTARALQPSPGLLALLSTSKDFQDCEIPDEIFFKVTVVERPVPSEESWFSSSLLSLCNWATKVSALSFRSLDFLKRLLYLFLLLLKLFEGKKNFYSRTPEQLVEGQRNPNVQSLDWKRKKAKRNGTSL